MEIMCRSLATGRRSVNELDIFLHILYHTL
jgi:hypothetical protein